VEAVHLARVERITVHFTKTVETFPVHRCEFSRISLF
jgi:hypothetical protein